MHVRVAQSPRQIVPSLASYIAHTDWSDYTQDYARAQITLALSRRLRTRGVLRTPLPLTEVMLQACYVGHGGSWLQRTSAEPTLEACCRAVAGTQLMLHFNQPQTKRWIRGPDIVIVHCERCYTEEDAGV